MLNDKILHELEEYCSATGWKASTVCVRALNDSKFVDRHSRRLERIAADEARLRAYMAENPAPVIPAGAAGDASDQMKEAS